MIHPTALVDPEARIGTNCSIGPYAMVEAGARIGDDCVIGPYARITGAVRMGSGNRLHAGCVIGDRPQDIRFTEKPTLVILGDNNVLREHVTIHRSNDENEPTTIGSNNFLMVNCHVGHNARIGDHVIIANGALIAGHVRVDDRAFISGNCLVHQFTRVGTLALMQGGAAISKDLPPFTIATGDNRICGLNTIGLRRAGISSQDRLELKRLYQLFFRSGRKFREALLEARNAFKSECARLMIEFLAGGKRGFCSDVSRGGAREKSDE